MQLSRDARDLSNPTSPRAVCAETDFHLEVAVMIESESAAMSVEFKAMGIYVKIKGVRLPVAIVAVVALTAVAVLYIFVIR